MTERDKRAAKTTIVGGQPPGNERDLQPIPVGIEHLLAMAAVDAEFAATLYRDRRGAVEASGVQLTPTEEGILAAVDAATLEQMVANVGSSIPEPDRRAFLGRSAAALLALASGGVAAAAGCEDHVVVKGIRPQRPATGPKPPPPTPPAPPPKPDPSAPPPEPAGIRPDRPEPKPKPPEPVKTPDAGPPPKPQPRGIRPDRPKPKGIRPDRPKPKTRGISPDRPRPGKTRGIRPDRPGDLTNPFDDEG